MELAKRIAQKLDWNGKINWYTREIRDGEIYYLNSSNDKITKATGWKPKASLDEGLNKTIAYWKEKLNY
jgi:nucleoside-diphosphate-sugar epimerase